MDATPIANVLVHFQNADSSLVASMMTDATGTASALMAAGGFVTAINPWGATNTFEIDTYASVKPGDHLVLHKQTATFYDVSITPLFDGTTGATNYQFYSTCSFAQGNLLIAPQAIAPPTPSSVQMNNCGTSADTLLATTDMTSTFLDFIYAPAQAVASGGSIDFTGKTYTAAPGRSLTITNNPMPTAQLQITDALAVTGGLLLQQVVSATGSPATQSVNVPSIATATSIDSTSYRGAFATNGLIEWAPYSTSYSSDLGSKLLGDFATAPLFDQPTHTIKWTAAAGVTPEFVVGAIQAHRLSNDVFWNWYVAAPSATSIAYPVLPTVPFDYNVGSADVVGVLSLSAATVPGGYDAVRSTILSTSVSSFVAGPSGSIAVQTLFPPG